MGVAKLRQSAVSFQTAGLSFEGVVAQPDATGGPWPGIVICHPHPLHGGSMNNNVVMALALGLVEEGFVTLRFNFRGVGDSEGEHGQGETEFEEVLGALDLVKAWPDTRGKVGLVGYSFGSGVILRHESLYKEADAFALVSPALRYVSASPLKSRKLPALVVAGDRDRLVESDQLPTELKTFEREPESQIFEGVDHFWYGHEGRLVPEVARFFIEQLK
jgi:alpha/beta superfamily hydrolase